ncbi:MAG TPA: hypothetical protein VHJ34_00710 [Actinomycetota bacterium]|nr:hypothetical protein [Actinomycetota bacterium]
MRKRMAKLLSDQRGIAMVTVMFVAAVLTAVSSTAVFVSIRELQAGHDDRRATGALAVAEAGVDRTLVEIRRGDVDWSDISMSGCAGYPEFPTVTGSVGAGDTFEATLEVYEPAATNPADRVAPGACAGRVPRIPRPDDPQYFVIESTGRIPSAKRVVRQIVSIAGVGLPVGVYADNVTLNGTPNMRGISLVTRSDVYGREKLGFVGTDPYFRIADFWGESAPNASLQAPAGVHTLGVINYGKANGQQTIEHPPSLNCEANDRRGTRGQSLWDQSGNGGPITETCPTWPGTASEGGPAAGTYPPTSQMSADVFARTTPRPELTDQDYLMLRQAAKDEGVYCFIATSGASSCTKKGAAWPINVNAKIQDGDITGLPTNFVAYFEFEDASKALTTNEIKWGGNVWACGQRSAVLIVRRGSFQIQANTRVNGAIILPEGGMRDQGSFTINGTIIADSFDNLGNGTFSLDPCWLDNMPGPWLDVTARGWSEVDR